MSYLSVGASGPKGVARRCGPRVLPCSPVFSRRVRQSCSVSMFFNRVTITSTIADATTITTTVTVTTTSTIAITVTVTVTITLQLQLQVH